MSDVAIPIADFPTEQRVPRPKIMPGSNIESVTIAKQIRESISSASGISLSVIDSSQRDEDVFWPRASAMFLVRIFTPLTSIQIGEIFGGRDHGTVLNAIKSVKNRYGTEPRFKEWLSDTVDQLSVAFQVESPTSKIRNWSNKK
jgi:chromosomal replication initiation ATPase DnaA